MKTNKGLKAEYKQQKPIRWRFSNPKQSKQKDVKSLDTLLCF